MMGHKKRKVSVFSTSFCALLIATLVLQVKPSMGRPGDIINTVSSPAVGAPPEVKQDIGGGDLSYASQTGSLDYAHAVPIPPGRLGAEPSVGISYSSQAPMYGGIAAGWSLGFPMIERDYSQGVVGQGELPFVSSMAGGHRLVPVTETVAPGFNSYRAEYDDSYVRYEQADSNAGTLAGQWRARTLDGSVWYFGKHSGDESTVGGGVAPLIRRADNGTEFIMEDRQPLTRMVDRFGNTVRYYWLVDYDVGVEAAVELRIDRIEYSENANSGLESHAQVEFNWGGMEECETSTAPYPVPVGATLDMRSGYPWYSGRRPLLSIKTRVRDIPGVPMASAREVFEATYNYRPTSAICGPGDSMRYLESIDQKGTNPLGTASEPQITFEYGEQSRNFADSSQVFYGHNVYVAGGYVQGTLAWGRRGGYGSGGAGEPSLERTLLDFDGDGRLDLVRADQGATDCAFFWDRNTGDTFIPSGDAIPMPDGALTPGESIPWANGSSIGLAEGCSLSARRSLFEPHNTQACPAYGHYLDQRFIDMNADGLPDLVTAWRIDETLLNPDAPDAPAMFGSLLQEDFPGDLSTDGGCVDVDPDALEVAVTARGRECSFFDEAISDPLLSRAPNVSCLANIPNEPPNLPTTPQCPGGATSVPVSRNGYFPWTVYYNTGKYLHNTPTGYVPGQELSAPQRIWSPIPLDTAGVESSVGTANGSGTSSSHHALMDITGDGIVDAINLSQFGPTGWNSDYGHHWQVFAGSHDLTTGEFTFAAEPYPWIVPRNAKPNVGGSMNLGQGTPENHVFSRSQLVDVNADGLPDLLRQKDDELGLEVALNMGRGFCARENGFIGGYATTGVTALDRTGYDSVAWYCGPPSSVCEATEGSGTNLARVSDVDADGRPDLYNLWNPIASGEPLIGELSTPELFKGNGDGFYRSGTSTPQNTRLIRDIDVEAAQNFWWVSTDVMDINGDGLEEVVTGGEAPWTLLSHQETSAGKPMRLLNRIDNGQGLVTSITYRPYNSDEAAIDSATQQGMPSHIWAVDSVSTESLITAPGFTPMPPNVVDIRYGDAVYNKDNHGRYGFRGFTAIESSDVHALGISSGYSVTQQRYDYEVDWSGRLSLTTTYVNGFPGGGGSDLTSSIVGRLWSERTVMGGLSSSFVLAAEEGRNCEAFDGTFATEAACAASPASKTKTLEYSGSIALFNYQTWESGGGIAFDGEGARLTGWERNLQSDEDQYLVLLTQETRSRSNGVDFEPVASSHQTIHPSGLFQDSTYAHVDASHATESVTIVERKANGQVAWVKNPNQVAGVGLMETPGYSGFEITATSLENELGHIAKTTTDLGTGATLETRGHNPLDCSPTEKAGSRTEYDALGRPIASYLIGCDGPNGTYQETLVSIIQYVDFDGTTPAHVITTNVLDAQTGTTTTSTAYFDGAGRTLKTVVDNGAQPDIETSYEYSARGKLARYVGPNPSTNPSDTLASIDVTYGYDSLGRSIGMRHGTGTTAAPDPSSAAWHNGPSFVGTNISYGYDGVHTIQTTTEHVHDGLFGETKSFADFFGRITKVNELLEGGGYASTFYDYDGNGNLRYIKDADGVETFMEHDWLSRRKKITRDSRVWAYDYDKNGNLTDMTSPNDTGETPQTPLIYTSHIDYDELDRVDSRVTAVGTLSPDQIADYDAEYVNYTYDSCTNGIGRLCSVDTGNNLTSIYNYDWAGRPTSRTQVMSLPENIVDFGDGNTDPDFTETRTTYLDFNTAGMITDVWLADAINQNDATHLSYQFDATGAPNKLRWHAPGGVVDVDVERSDARMLTSQTVGCLTRTWDYDHMGRVINTLVEGNGCSTQNGIILSENMSYFDSSEVHTLSVYRAGLQQRTFEYDYDPQHQLVSADDVLGGGYRVKFGYSPAGLLDAVKDLDGQLIGRKQLAYSYGDGSLTGADKHAPTDLIGNELEIHYLYDFFGNVTSREEVDFSIDASILADFGMLAFLNQTTFTELDDEVPLNSQAATNLMAFRAGADTILYTADDVDFQTVAEVDGVSQVGPVALGLLYDYSAAHGWVPEPSDTMGSFDGVLFTYQEAILSLDLVNTASAAELDDPEPDGVGLSSTAVNSIMNARPIADMQTLAGLYFVGPAAMGDIKDYVNAQNAASAPSTTWTFAYDGNGQQREVLLENGTGGRELYFYDDGGKRYMQVTYDTYDSGTTNVPSRIRVWNGGAEIWYQPNFGTNEMEVATEYAHLSLGGISVGRIKREGILTSTEASFHSGLDNLMGSVDWETGIVNASFVYGPYGEIIETTGGTAELDTHLRRFNGKENDQLSKLNYYGYRYYDPQSLSWTQADPLYLLAPDLARGEPRRASLYRFSLNNPVRYYDPDGRDSGSAFIKAAGTAEQCGKGTIRQCKKGKTRGTKATEQGDADEEEESEGSEDGDGDTGDDPSGTGDDGEQRGSPTGSEDGTTTDTFLVDSDGSGPGMLSFLNPAVGPIIKAVATVAMAVKEGYETATGVGAIVKAGAKLAIRQGRKWLKRRKAGGGVCFVAGTKVLTENGEVAIEKIVSGDKVACADPESLQWRLCEVVEPSKRYYDGTIVTIDVGGEQIQATADHPFWVESGINLYERPSPEHLSRMEVGPQKHGRWIDAGDLRVGDRLTTANSTFRVAELAREQRSVDVYNLEVTPHHNYAVSGLGVLVHNRAMRNPLRVEKGLTGSKKHGLGWTEGPARAKKTGKPQGQFGSQADLDFVESTATDLSPGRSGTFDLPSGHSSVVHLPGGTTVPATRVWMKVRKSGTIHAFPLE